MYLNLNGRIILKWILNKCFVLVWTRSIHVKLEWGLPVFLQEAVCRIEDNYVCVTRRLLWRSCSVAVFV
jgi:hypothetical protein